jgi:carbon-monoxide dehydrogenase small subunit
MNGEPVRSCLVLAVEAEDATVETVEGLARGGQLHPIQQAFADAAAVQCGFCTPGLILATKALLDRHPQPSEEHIREAVEGHLCRCTGYQAIFQAIRAVVASRENL